MIDRFLPRDACRDLAQKWRSDPDSPLGKYGRTGIIEQATLNEIIALHSKPLAPEQRAELLNLGQSLAAYRFEHDAKTYDSLKQSAPSRGNATPTSEPAPKRKRR